MFFGGLTIDINGFSMVFDFASIAFNGFRWFRTIGLAIAEMIGQLLTLTTHLIGHLDND